MANLNPSQTLEQNIASLIAVVTALEVEAGVSSFDGRTGAVVPTTGDYTVAKVTGAAPLASPTFTGTVTIPTGASISGYAPLVSPTLTTPQFTAYTVATLPVGAEGQLAYASDGLKVGESPSAGTGVPVYFSNALWRVFSTDAQVAS